MTGGTGLRPVVSGVAPETAPAGKAFIPNRTSRPSDSRPKIRRDAEFDRPEAGSTRGFLGELRSAVMVTVMLAVVCCGLYPLLVFGLGQLLFHDKANGSLIVDDKGVVRGSRLLGQPFTAAKYFHPRPSAATVTTPPVRAAATWDRLHRSSATPSPRTSPITGRKTAWPPTRPFPPTPSRLRAAGWTHISASATPNSRHPAWLRPER